MAAEPQLYSVIYVLGDGGLLAEETSTTLQRETGSTPAKTVAKGYAGETPGAPMSELDVENLVPMDGMEFDVGEYMQAMKPIEMGLQSHGKTYIFKGFATGDVMKHGVGQDASYSFKVRGAMGLWQK